jgi:hypothetical protein
MSLVLRRARAVALAACAVAVIPMVAAAQAAPTVQQIHEKYVAAIGGRAAWAAIQSMSQKASVAAGAMGTFTSEQVIARSGKMAMTITAPFGELRNGFDGEVAWGINPMQGATILTGAEADAMKQGASLGLLTYEPGSFKSATLVGAADFEGRKTWHVKITPTVGPELNEYFDQATGLKIGFSAKAATQMGEIESTTRLQEYTQYGAVKMPKIIVQSNPMAGEITITIESVEFNKVADAAFALPDAVKALRK